MNVDRYIRVAAAFAVILGMSAAGATAQATSEGGLAVEPMIPRAKGPPQEGPATIRMDIRAAVVRALEANRDVRDAELTLELAEEQVDEAWGSLFPTLDFNSAYTRNLDVPVSWLPGIIFDPEAPPDLLVPVRFGADNSWNTNFRLEQPIFEAGALIGVGTAGRFRAFQTEGLRGRSQGAVTQVRNAYYGLLLDVENQRLLQASVDRVSENLAETEALNRAGLSSDYDVLRLQVELTNLQANLERALNAVVASKRTLGVLLDMGDGENIEVVGTLAEMDLESLEANGLDNRQILAFTGYNSFETERPETIDLSQEGRSDIRQGMLNEDLRRAELRLEQGEYLPKISAVGNYTWSAQYNGGFSFWWQEDQRASFSSIGFVVTLPVFTGTKRHNRIQQKQVALRQAQTQTELIRDQAEAEVRTLLDQVEEARRRALAQAAAVRQAQRGFDIASAQYREGLGSQLQITDSEEALRQSQFNYAQAVFDFLIARSNLDLAVGVVPGVDLEPGDLAPQQ
jgi:outer membrane protein TolC